MGDDGVPHRDGLRASLDEHDGLLTLLLELKADGDKLAGTAIDVRAAGVDAMAAMSRQLVVAQAIASFLTYGGSIDELRRCVEAFAALATRMTPTASRHVFTRVDATRTHVFRDDDAREFLVITEDSRTERMSPADVRASIIEPPQREYRPTDDEDWSFVDSIPEADDDDDHDGGPEGLQSLPPPAGR